MVSLGPLAQLVRALRLHRRCRRFESGRAHRMVTKWIDAADSYRNSSSRGPDAPSPLPAPGATATQPGPPRWPFAGNEPQPPGTGGSSPPSRRWSARAHGDRWRILLRARQTLTVASRAHESLALPWLVPVSAVAVEFAAPEDGELGGGGEPPRDGVNVATASRIVLEMVVSSADATSSFQMMYSAIMCSQATSRCCRTYRQVVSTSWGVLVIRRQLSPARETGRCGGIVVECSVRHTALL